MKKFYMAVAAVAFCATMMSCTSVADKAKDYEARIADAVSSGNFGEAAEITAEYNEWFDSLSEEDQKKAAQSAMDNLFK